MEGREDWRKIPLVTIDPADAKDHDDDGPTATAHQRCLAQFGAPEVRLQRLGNSHGAIGLLMMLQQARDDAREGEGRSVERMHELAKQSKPFSDFLNNRILKLLEESRTALRNNFASQALTEQSLESPLGDLTLKKPISVLPNTPLKDALQLIHEKKVGSVLVVDEVGIIQGILTRYDVLSRVTLAQTPLDTPIAAVMSTQVKTVQVDDSVRERVRSIFGN